MTFLILSAVVLSALSASRNPDSPDLIAITPSALGTPSASTILSTLRALALVDTLSAGRNPSPVGDCHRALIIPQTCHSM